MDLSTAQFELTVASDDTQRSSKASRARRRAARRANSQLAGPGTVVVVTPNPDGDGPLGGPVKEICDYPMGPSSISGRCQVGTIGGGTQECDCEAEINTTHNDTGACVYEVIDLVVVGNCDGGGGERDEPPTDIGAGF